MVMFGDDIGDKLWETVNTSFRFLFDEYKEMYAPHEKTPQPIDSKEQPSHSKRLMRSIVAQHMNNNGGGNITVKSELDKYLSKDNEEDKIGFDILNR
jgi:hypothetical protein